MIRKIKVINRFNADLIIREMIKPPSDYWYLISIYGWPDQPLLTPFGVANAEKLGCKKHLSLDFHDVVPAQYEQQRKAFPTASKKIKLFSKAQAIQIVEFINETKKDPNGADLIVHCHAGISRSGAVATYIAEKLGIDFHDPEIRPNSHVLSVLRMT
jgi:predicted protein tyrosine phosphatase